MPAQSLMGVLEPGQLLAVGQKPRMRQPAASSGFISSRSRSASVTLSGGVGPYGRYRPADAACSVSMIPARSRLSRGGRDLKRETSVWDVILAVTGGRRGGGRDWVEPAS